MKVSIMMAAGAGFAAATPVHIRQTESPLKLFKQPDDSIRSCGSRKNRNNTEACVGTLEYCQKGFYEQFGESFSSAEECVGSRQDPSLKPFFSGPNWDDMAACGNPLFGGNTQRHSEPCVGTAMYCSKGYWAEYKEESFSSEEECIKVRNPEFAAPKPAPAPPSEPESKPTSKSASESVSEPAPESACVQAGIAPKAPEEDEDRWVWA